MKKRIIYSSLIIASTFLASCKKDFTELNIDPNKTTSELFDPNFLLSQSQIKFSNTGYDQLLYQSMWSQALASTYDYYGNGDKYVYRGSGRSYQGRTWNTSYDAATLVIEMKNLLVGKDDLSNLNNIATIMRVLELQRVTDTYGDIPYSEAGQAKTGLVTPKFDSQQSIYTSMLSELETATAALDASKSKPTADLFYNGDITQWKKFGYSLMLRLAMRLTKVDPATAKSYAEKAYAGGTMSGIADNAKVRADNTNGYGNSNANALLVVDDFREVRWSKPLIDYMQTTSDPRISSIAEISAGNGKAANETKAAGINTASLQKGLPNGYDLSGGKNDVSKAPGYPGSTPAASDKDAAAPLGLYSRPRFQVYEDQSGVNMLLTYGETELLLAEASVRGWNTGSAAVHYANALAANMSSLSQLNNTPVAAVDPGAIATYVIAHPLNVTSTAASLQQINMEYWVATASMFNFNETWSNWRRSGFPVLTPVVYEGQFTDGSIPRRIPYPITLPSTNSANYSAAVAALSGGDTYSARVWWDKP
jgi:hypothetical protein